MARLASTFIVRPLSAARPFSSRRGRPRRFERAFTLIEMMIVVVIIGLFAALAAPSVTALVRDQRARRESLSIMDLYREARARSLGRGSAVDITYSVTAAQSDFVVREGTGANGIPYPSCQTFDSSTPVNIAHTRPGWTTDTPLLKVTASIWDAATADPGHTIAGGNYIEVCYAPSGRVYYRQLASDPFTLLTGRVEYAIQRNDTGYPGLTRTVQVNADATTQMKL